MWPLCVLLLLLCTSLCCWTIYYVSFVRAVKIHLDLRNGALLFGHNGTGVALVRDCTQLYVFVFCPGFCGTKLLSLLNCCSVFWKISYINGCVLTRIQVQVANDGALYCCFFSYFVVFAFEFQTNLVSLRRNTLFVYYTLWSGGE